MARAFTTNQQISGTTTVTKNQTYYTITGWMRRPTSGSIQAFGTNETTNHRTCFFHFSDNYVYACVSNGGLQAGYFIENITGWNHYAMVFDGSQSTNATRLKFYVNSVSKTQLFLGTIPSSTSNDSANETFRIGRNVRDNVWSTGDFAELGMWQSALSAQEVASLADGMTCDKIRPQSLVTYIPLVRDIQDLARGMTLTNTNSTVAAHPRVYA
jgi:hypothetical protein